MSKPKSFVGLLAVMLILAVTLEACGETATPASTAPAAVTTAQSTNAATTAAATTVVTQPTTNPATSAVATTTATDTMLASPTTSIATTVIPATTPAANNSGAITNNLPVPNISGLEEIPLDQAVLDYFNQSIGDALSKSSSSVRFVGLKYFGSDDSVVNVDENVDKAMLGAGYNFLPLMPGQTKLNNDGKTNLGIYTKDGSPDLFVTVVDTQNTGQTNLDTALTPAAGKTVPASIPALINKLKAKKTVVAIIGANGYAQLFKQVASQLTASPKAVTPTTK